MKYMLLIHQGTDPAVAGRVGETLGGGADAVPFPGRGRLPLPRPSIEFTG
jgi:hypothetical protein